MWCDAMASNDLIALDDCVQNGETPLQRVAGKNNTNVMYLLTRSGADIHAKDKVSSFLISIVVTLLS